MDISIIIPTRHRPQNIDRIITETKGSLGRQFEMVLGIDEDDENYDIERLKNIKGVKVIRTPATPYLSNLYNIIFEYCEGDIIGYYGDDVSFVDMQVLDDIKSTFQKKGDILYFFADRNQTVNLGMHSKAHTSVSVNTDPYPLCVPCHAFVSRNSIRALGFLHLPNFEHGYSDHYLGYVYKEVGQYHLHCGPKPFTTHNRPPNQVDREPPLWDDIYETKSVLTDAEGRTADDRDKIKFDEFRTRYLALHQQIILDLHTNRWQQTFPKRY